MNLYGVYIADFVMHCLKKASHVFVMHKALLFCAYCLYVEIYTGPYAVLRVLYVMRAFTLISLLSLLHHTLSMAFYMSQEKNKQNYICIKKRG